MRGLLIFLPALLMAQAPPPKPAAVSPQPTGAKSAAGAKPAATVKPPAPKSVAAAKPLAPPPLTTDDEKAIYAIGLTISRQLSQLDLSPAELEIVKRALADAAANKPALESNEWGPKIQPLAAARAARV